MTARPILFSGPMVRALLEGRKTQTRRVIKFKPWHQIEERDDGKPWPWMYDDDNSADCWVPCPYGQPGDLLWVREKWAPQADCEASAERWNSERTGPKPLLHFAADQDADPWISKWRPSIHMPRWASRLTLRITDVRVQRLADISEADAIAEGITLPPGPGYGPIVRSTFTVLWDSINGQGSFDSSPWIWALTFDVIKANVDQVSQ